MYRLLAANFYRLWKSRIFWGMELICALAGSFFSMLAMINTKNLGEAWYRGNGNYYFFIGLLLIGFAVAIFASFFLGTEYAEATLRNKLTVGHSRSMVYLSNMILCVVSGLIFLLTQMLFSVLIGLPFLGTLLWDSLAPLSWRIPCAVILVCCYAAIFTFFAMSDSSKARNTTISLILSILIALAGLYTLSRLNEPEITSRMVMQQDGSYLREEVVNEHYLKESERWIYTFFDAMLPSSQAMRICNSDSVFVISSPLMLAAVSIGFTLGGIVRFTKKDIV